jgi:hypothetical protein
MHGSGAGRGSGVGCSRESENVDTRLRSSGLGLFGVVYRYPERSCDASKKHRSLSGGALVL